MSFWRFIREKLFALVLFLCALALIYLGLWLFNVPTIAVVFVELILIVAGGTVVIYEYARKRRFLTDLVETSEGLEKKYLLPELLERPAFYEGQLFYDALVATGKAMNDEVAAYRRSTEEYREYVETWVHEIKTPIAANRLIIENGRDGLSPSSLKALTEEQERIEALVEQVLFYARSTALEQDYLIRKVNLEQLVKDVLKKHARALIESKMSPRLEGLSLTVLCDQKWLAFILGQLVSNAIRYRSDHDPCIAFSAYHKDEHTYLHVQDNGIGISPADLPRIFQKGFTGEHGRSFSKTTGMGLYLCKKLCDKMGIGLSATSIEGESTTFMLDFPENRMQLDVVSG